MAVLSHRASIESIVVTADQMRRIEGVMFDQGMPVPALMEKVAGLITAWLIEHFSPSDYAQVGVLVGPGHNGGDALVVARELWFKGYGVTICCPLDKQKPLTADHLRFVQSLGIPIQKDFKTLSSCGFILDGLFGFGLERPLKGALADVVDTINTWSQPVVSIDLPSGLHTNTGEVLGTALKATHTLCLGLWKLAFCQSRALTYLGHRHLIDFHIPPAALKEVLSSPPQVQRMTSATARLRLPLPRTPDTHKYRVGHGLVVAGSRQFAGAAILTGLGARGSGIGMLSLAVPESLRWLLVKELPEALVIGCPETDTGAIAHLPDDWDLASYDAVVCGPGLSRQATGVLKTLLNAPVPLVLDADGLNMLADLNPLEVLPKRNSVTVLTPHPGEFKRLFPDIAAGGSDPGQAAQTAAHQSNAVVLLKGACTVVAHPDGRLWYIDDSTPALARGGSGDILAGLVGGLLTQSMAAGDETLDHALDAAMVGTWWHAQAAKQAAARCTQLGVDGKTLAAYLNPALAEVLS
jgi:NAD(P)H-hydrate epimerase